MCVEADAVDRSLDARVVQQLDNQHEQNGRDRVSGCKVTRMAGYSA
jgi:hypothetical protein